MESGSRMRGRQGGREGTKWSGGRGERVQDQATGRGGREDEGKNRVEKMNVVGNEKQKRRNVDGFI